MAAYPNRFAGVCLYCRCAVAAGEGLLHGNRVVCSPVVVRFVPSDTGGIAPREFCERTAPAKSDTAVVQATAEDIAAARKADRKARREWLQQHKQQDTCPRCNGKGGSDAWHMSGWTCNRCHGTGRY